MTSPFFVGLIGLEPMTPTLSTWCSEPTELKALLAKTTKIEMWRE